MYPTKYEAEKDIFFPGKGKRNLGQQAKEICKGCPVTAECKEYARKTESRDGIWGE